VLTLVTKSFLCFSDLHFLRIRQYLGRLPIGHEFEAVGTTGQCEEKDKNHSLCHYFVVGVLLVMTLRAIRLLDALVKGVVMGREIFFFVIRASSRRLWAKEDIATRTPQIFFSFSFNINVRMLGNFCGSLRRSSTWPDDITERAISDKQTTFCLSGRGSVFGSLATSTSKIIGIKPSTKLPTYQNLSSSRDQLQF
jgi:hypothetical protein